MFEEIEVCPLCDRSKNVIFSHHHLIPVVKGGRKMEKANICLECHRQIHALFTNNELRDELNTVESIRNHPLMQSFLAFIRKRPYGSLRIDESNRRLSKRGKRHKKKEYHKKND